MKESDGLNFKKNNKRYVCTVAVTAISGGHRSSELSYDIKIDSCELCEMFQDHGTRYVEVFFPKHQAFKVVKRVNLVEVKISKLVEAIYY